MYRSTSLLLPSLALAIALGVALPLLAFAHPFGAGGQNLSDDARTALQTCRSDHESHDDMKTCAEAVAQEYGFELPERPERPEISEEARAALEDCRENNESVEDKKACAQDVVEEYGIELPAHRHGHGGRFGRFQRPGQE
mgnify:CR=1 FL=1